jgi:hypothetical protein
VKTLHRRVSSWLAIVAIAVGVSAVPAPVRAGASSDNLLELATRGGASVGLGFGVSPLHWEPLAPPESVAGSAAAERLLGESRGRAVSFDLKLRWPTADLPIEPYVVLGPALFVDQPQDLSMTAIPGDPVVRLGAKAGAGFNWRLGKDATLFGSYDVTTSAADRFALPGSKGSAANGPVGYDLLYGVRFGF